MPVPQNAKAIYTYLTGQGFSANAAAGILGNIEQESGGNPEEAGGGLIQILGQAGGTLTEQLAATMKYILANGSVADINAHATSPTAAALYFSTAYERPDAAKANNANREASATAVAQAASSGKWPEATAAPASNSGGILGDIGALGNIATAVGDIGKDFNDVATAATWLINPGHWLRIGAFFVGLILLAVAVYTFTKSPGNSGTVPIPVPI